MSEEIDNLILEGVVKTDFTLELANLISKMYEPATDREANGVMTLTLNNIHYQIVNILPDDYIDKTDVWACLQKLGYEPHNVCGEQLVMKEGKETIIKKYGLYYLLKNKD